MAESFRNFIKTANTGSSSEVIVIPSGTSSSSDSRDAGSVAQVHSIYISQYTSSKYKGIERYNPKNFNAFNLYIKDTVNNNKVYIVFDGRIVPGSPFFIEKNITLEVTQALCIECPQDSYDYNMENNASVKLNSNGATLHITASAVLFPDANQ